MFSLNLKLAYVAVSALVLFPSLGTANESEPKKLSGALLMSTRFESGPMADPKSFEAVDKGNCQSSVENVAEGTIDASSQGRTLALKWTVLTSGRTSAASGARVTSPVVNISNTESDVRRLTIGFDLWVSQVRPVWVSVCSVGSDGSVTGSLSAQIAPPVAGAFYRFTPNLGTFQLSSGKFDPLSSQIRFSFEVGSSDAPLPDREFVLKVDNLSYSMPSYYVSETGSDTADGRTESTAFATIQHAVDVAVPGDNILVLNGTYIAKERERLVTINKAGEPDRWITIQAAPGAKPVLRATGWDVLSIKERSAYWEIRGLTAQGYVDDITLEEAQADEALRTKDGKPYFGDPRCNTNGFTIDSRDATETMEHTHHIRFINNIARDLPGGGICGMATDHVTIEGNLSLNNCHRMRYAGSGIGFLTPWNCDTDTGYKLFVIGNRSIGNRCYVKWSELAKISDGNGIILDSSVAYDWSTNKTTDHPYLGRTLVQNNISVGNGGSGIHAYASYHVDIINNTAYYNSQSPELSWRQIFASLKCRDIHIVNNIMWAQKGRPLHTAMGDSADVIYDHNLMFGDGDNGVAEGGGLGAADSGKQAEVIAPLTGNPLFVHPSTDPTTADFHLRYGSPAISAGVSGAMGVPIRDIDGTFRSMTGAVDLGALRAYDQ